MAAPKVTTARQDARKRSAEQRVARKVANREAQLAAERENRENRELRAAGLPTPWQLARKQRAKRRGHA